MLVVIGSLFLLLGTAGANAQKPMTKQVFEPKDRVPVYVNMMGPLRDPWDVRDFYSLPFCQPHERKMRKRTFREAVEGDTIQDSAYYVRFREPAKWGTLCVHGYDKYEIEMLKRAVAEEYVAELVVDDVRMRHLIGYCDDEDDDKKSSRCFLFNHLYFTFFVNGNRIVFANISVDSAGGTDSATNAMKKKSVELRDDQTVIEYSYSVEWVESSVPYALREEVFQYNYFGVWEPGALRWMVFLVGVGLGGLLFIIGIVVLIMQGCLYHKEG
jgi:transmembrane 9 superfamily protein 1